MNLIDSLKAVRRSGVPLVAIETAEPRGAFEQIKVAIGDKWNSTVVLTWNLMSGLVGANKIGQPIADGMNEGNDPALVTGRPDEMLRKIRKVPQDSIVVMFGAEKVFEDISVRQGIWNLRDQYKSAGCTLFTLVPFGSRLTPDIKDDVVVLRHNLPTEDALAKLAMSLADDAGVSEKVDEEMKLKAVDATLGLSEFAAEQVMAMSLSKSGYDLQELWDRKRTAIEQTAGLSVWKGGEKFADIGGLDQAKYFFTRLLDGKRKPRCVVFIDEIEKAMAGQGDTSGTNQEMLGILLTWMQDKGATGFILVGAAGSGKSAISKSVGNEGGIPTVAFDMSAMKGSLVGQSGERLRSALATVDAIGQGRVLVLATCNSITSLPPELRRRFTLGTFFFDLPSKEERAAIWSIYKGKYSLTCEIPDDTGWTGAEIKQCCDIADRLAIPLVEAATFVVPLAKSAAEVIENLRKGASGRFLSASYTGVYRYEQAAPAGQTGGRRIEV